MSFLAEALDIDGDDDHVINGHRGDEDGWAHCWQCINQQSGRFPQDFFAHETFNPGATGGLANTANRRFENKDLRKKAWTI